MIEATEFAGSTPSDRMLVMPTEVMGEIARLGRIHLEINGHFANSRRLVRGLNEDGSAQRASLITDRPRRIMIEA